MLVLFSIQFEHKKPEKSRINHRDRIHMKLERIDDVSAFLLSYCGQSTCSALRRALEQQAALLLLM